MNTNLDLLPYFRNTISDLITQIHVAQAERDMFIKRLQELETQIKELEEKLKTYEA